MRTFIDNLLETRKVSNAIPFWKLQVTDTEFEKLIEYIRGRLENIPFESLNREERKQRYKEFDRELCLMYAIWWNRYYSGGRGRYAQALNKFSISTSYLNWIQEAIQYEILNHKRLHIPLFYGQNTVRKIDSVLAQGGLPMQLMNREGASSSYENYLYYLISEYEKIDERDWQKIDKAKDLANHYLPNQTMGDSEAFLAFSMEIVKSYINDDNSFFDTYHEIKQIINKIKERKRGERQAERKSFKVNWGFQIIGNQIKLLYSLDVPEKITGNDDSDYLSYYIEDRLAGFYQKRGENTYVRMPQTSFSGWKEWNQFNKGLSFKKKTASGIYEENLLNSIPPFIGEPILLQYDSGNVWTFKSNGDGNGCGCLFPSDWSCANVVDAKELNIDGVNLLWKELDQIDLQTNPLQFSNKITQETVTLDGHQSPYFVSFSPHAEEWIESSSKTVLMDNGDRDIRRFFKCFQDDEPCNNQRNFKFCYRTNDTKDYIDYAGGSLPVGIIYMKVIMPDNHSRTFSFFRLDGFSYKRLDKHTIHINYDNGTFALMANQNVEKIEDGVYQIIENDNLKGFAPVWFRLFPDTTRNEHIDIGVKSPIQQSCFFDCDGRILPKNYSLSINELYRFHINIEEFERINVAYYETKDDSPNSRCLIRKEVSLPAGRYSLDVLRDDIERLFGIYGFDDYRKYVSLRIRTECEIKIRRYTYLAQEYQREDGSYGIYVTRNNEPARNLRLYAFAINASEDIKEMSNDGDGHYSLSPNDINEEKEFVVFSDNSMTNENMLPYFLNVAGSLTLEERNQNKHDSIEHIHELLVANDEKEWNKVWNFLGIVIDKKLPYSHSFNCFLAIANDPYLLASFIVRMSSFNRFDINTLIFELQRMEKELSFGFHYLPVVCWQREVQRMESIYNTLPQTTQVIIGERDNYIWNSFHILEKLMCKEFGERGQIIEGKLVTGLPSPSEPNFPQNIRESVNNALSDFSLLILPDRIRFARVELHEQFPRRDQYVQLMQYMAVVLPQCAAQYAHGADMELWNYNPDTPYRQFIRRMINYMSTYVPEIYNELFTIALLREPVEQVKNK